MNIEQVLMLETAIAQRFCVLSKEDWPSLTRSDRQFYRRLADECIRQMEWTREEMRGSFSEPGREIKPSDMPVLTLAPENWKP